MVHIVGGGSRNDLLCQLTADATGLPVVAGPAEATALGNVLVQARALGAAPGTLEGMRALIRALRRTADVPAAGTADPGWPPLPDRPALTSAHAEQRKVIRDTGPRDGITMYRYARVLAWLTVPPGDGQALAGKGM